MSGTIELANGRASGPILTLGFLVILDHSAQGEEAYDIKKRQEKDAKMIPPWGKRYPRVPKHGSTLGEGKLGGRRILTPHLSLEGGSSPR